LLQSFQQLNLPGVIHIVGREARDHLEVIELAAGGTPPEVLRVEGGDNRAQRAVRAFQ
jgi:hypothetical protein